MADSTPKSYSSDTTLWLYTSFSSGSSRIVTATSRLETILRANRIIFSALDVATDEKARMLWGRRAGQRKLPGLVRMGMVLGDLEEVEEWNEYGELKERLAFGEGPTDRSTAPQTAASTTTASSTAPNTDVNPTGTASVPATSMPVTTESASPSTNIDPVDSGSRSLASTSDVKSTSTTPGNASRPPPGSMPSPIALALRQAGAEAASQAKQQSQEKLRAAAGLTSQPSLSKSNAATDPAPDSDLIPPTQRAGASEASEAVGNASLSQAANSSQTSADQEAPSTATALPLESETIVSEHRGANVIPAEPEVIAEVEEATKIDEAPEAEEQETSANAAANAGSASLHSAVPEATKATESATGQQFETRTGSLPEDDTQVNSTAPAVVDAHGRESPLPVDGENTLPTSTVQPDTTPASTAHADPETTASVDSASKSLLDPAKADTEKAVATPTAVTTGGNADEADSLQLTSAKTESKMQASSEPSASASALDADGRESPLPTT